MTHDDRLAHHIVLLGDSIFDNGSYVSAGEKDVAEHLQVLIGDLGWQVELRALDGSVAAGIPRQLDPEDGLDGAVCVMSTGGNDALGHIHLLGNLERDKCYADVLMEFHGYRERFRNDYASALEAVLATGAQLIVCTIYNGAFPDPAMARLAATGVAFFNDVIYEEATRRDVPVIELRSVCTTLACFANEIEPSHEGGRRIAEAIEAAVKRIG